MSTLIESRDPSIPLKDACEALGLPRATWYRRHSVKSRPAPVPRRTSSRRLSDAERTRVLDVLHEPRFIDQPPAEVYAKLLGEGTYLCSIRTMHRLLADVGESGERRAVRPRTYHAAPRLSATAPNQVWTWDISKLATFARGVFLNLYVVLDLYSRYVVAWMVAGRENSALAKQLLAQAIMRHDIPPGQLHVHQDRGAPMTAHGFLDLLAALGVDRSHSRPRVSNDNAFSESQFKTLKYQPDYPGRFRDAEAARAWCAEFFDWYNSQHQHSGLALFTPADVFFGRVDELVERRQAGLDAGYAAHPERFVRGRPVAARPPAVVSINPVQPGSETSIATHPSMTSPTDEVKEAIAT